MIVSWDIFGLWPFKYVSKLGVGILISIFWATLFSIFSFLLCILGTELFLTHKLDSCTREQQAPLGLVLCWCWSYWRNRKRCVNSGFW